MDDKIYSMSTTDLQEEANKIKDLVIETLATEGLLKGNHEEIGSDYVVVVRSKGVFGRLFDQYFNIDQNLTQYKILKSIKREVK